MGHDEFAVFGEKRYFNHDDWISSRKEAGLPDNWDAYEEHLLLGRTTPDLKEEADGLEKCITNADVSHNVESGPVSLGQIQSGDRVFLCGGLPVADNQGRLIAVLFSLVDITDRAAENRAANFFTMAIAVFLLAASIVLGVFISRTISQPIESLSKAIEEISEGNMDVVVEGTQRDDEIGRLARAFDRTAVTIKLAMKKKLVVIMGGKKEEKKP